jgi:hypothetical protein
MRFMLLLGFVPAHLFAQEVPEALPATVETCLQDQAVRGRIAVSLNVNPYYLRGDFDGDGKIDYAVAVKGTTSGKLRVLICTGTKRVFLLGSEGNGPAFSDMADDNFFAPSWMVYTRAEVNDLTKYTSNVPQAVPASRGEAIAMVWEDGISLIYWDGAKFRWAGSKQ